MVVSVHSKGHTKLVCKIRWEYIYYIYIFYVEVRC